MAPSPPERTPADTQLILVAPQEFKGSLTAPEAARAISRGVRCALPRARVFEAPMADGGPGTAALVSAAAGGKLIEGHWRGPLGAPVAGAYALIRASGEPGALAVIEAATAAGLTLLPEARRDPARASTHGVGEQIRDALARGAGRVVIGVGGTGTNDGGAGAAQALGYRLLDDAGRDLGPGGLELARLVRIDAGGVDPLLRATDVRVAVDVTNPLLGVEGATAVYGPQKGVTVDLAPRLEAALARWAELCRRDLGVEIATLQGGGAGGGLAGGLVTAAGASVESGAALVGEAIGLPARVAAADLVVTGEGRLDAQTARGKTIAYVAALARDAGRPCLAVVGAIDGAPEGLAGSDAAAPAGMPLNEAMARAAELVEAAAGRLLRRYAAAAGNE